MRFLSVCSGIEAASVAWGPLGWKAAAFSEIEPFPCAVLAHHYPDVPNHGDMTRFNEWPDHAIDLLCGGTPCQSFSNAGLRAGLDDPRGQLMLTFGAIAARYRPRWLVWENVPGVLSSNGGRDFGAFLGLLGYLGYGFAYRVLDAQFVRVDGHGRAVPQRRQRVFVVGCLGDWRSAAAVLLERESLRGDPAPRRSAGASVAGTVTARAANGCPAPGHEDGRVVAGALAGTGPGAGWRIGPDEAAAHHRVAYGGNNTSGPRDVASALSFIAQPYRVHGENSTAMRGNGSARVADECEVSRALDTNGGYATNQGGNIIAQPLAFDPTQITSRENRSNPQPGDPCHTLAKGAHAPAIAFDARQSDVIQYGDKAGPLDTDAFSQAIAYDSFNQRLTGEAVGAMSGGDAGNRMPQALIGTRVRRLMPVECERLMGFPDGYTAITYRGKPAADGPRYKALGNSWAINCVRWIGRRISLVDSLSLGAAA